MAARTAKTEGATLFDKLRKEVKVPAPLVITDEITLFCPTKELMDKASAATSEEESNRILIGEKYDALVELFGGEAPHLWREFNEIYLEHFFDVPRAPKS